MGRGPHQELELSVVLPVDEYRAAETVIACIGSQTIAERIELVVVTPSPDSFPVASAALEPLGSVQVVPVASMPYLPQARAVGIQVARAPVAVLAETHAFPSPEWAEFLVRAHRMDCAAVGPGLTNANPQRAASWANLMLDYGPWLYPAEAGEVTNLPGHNSSYKKSAIAQLDGRLERFLEIEYVLHREMRARGMRLLLEPRARISHLNVTRFRSWARERFVGGRAFAAARAVEWSPARRFAYAAGSPLIPAIRAMRLLGVWRRCAHVRRLPRALPAALLYSLVTSAAGEAVGYLAGGVDSQRTLLHMELYRHQHTSDP